MKRLRGSGTHNSPMNLDNAPRPQRQVHAGSFRPLGITRGPPQPRQYGVHGGTNLRMGVLKKRK
jgi:hypothetical protein